MTEQYKIEPKNHILFVDDQWCRSEEQATLVAAYGPLQSGSRPYVFQYETAESASGNYSATPVVARLRGNPRIGAVVLDIKFGSESDRLGLTILEAIREEWPTLPVFMMTSIEGDLEVVEQAMELGANEYLVKKPSLESLRRVFDIYVTPSGVESDFAIWGNASLIRNVRALIARVSYSGNVAVYIAGESGTGKELIARAIHRQGMRRTGPFVAKNCAFDNSSLLDSELFGHERGAFTGAERRHVGLIERSDGGILFLDEIGSMPLELQGKLLRVLEDRGFNRLGGTEVIRSDFQLICATNENLHDLVDRDRFREDLYYRIRHFDIESPPLRERAQDISLLAQLFLERFRSGAGASYRAIGFTENAREALKGYQWPGNVRELKNVVERAAILSRKSYIDIELLPPELRTGQELGPFDTAVERDKILADDQARWPRQRVYYELVLAIEAKERIKRYKGNQWRAELMRWMYPACKARSAKGFGDMIKRLTKGPWGIPDWQQDEEISVLIRELIGNDES